jgi:hypothetical protein
LLIRPVRGAREHEMMLLAETGMSLSRKFLAERDALAGAPAAVLALLPRVDLRFAV